MMRVRVAFDMAVDKPTDAAKVLEKMLAAADGGVEDFSWTMKGQVPFFAESRPVRNGKRVARREITSRTRSDDF